MSVTAAITVSDYLSTTYRPDCDYIDGVLVERNVGRKDHSKLQRNLVVWFHARSRSHGLATFVEQRLRIGPKRFRIPDVCVVQLPEPEEQVFSRAPFLCLEVLSPEDTLAGLQQRFDDYLAMGVRNIWVIDPATRRAWSITHEGHFEALDGFLRTHDQSVVLPIADLFLG